VERLAVARAKQTFGAQYANVQPHSGTAANQIVLTALLERGDKILSLGTDQGGHLSHGAKVSFSGKFLDVENYYVDKETFLLDYDQIGDKALTCKPKLIICGASAYSRVIDFQKFRRIADEVGAFLCADISHIAGLVIAGAHPSPTDETHFTTTSTYKPGGPRGGLILMGRDYDTKIAVSGKKTTLAEHIQKTTFPGVQGTPYLNNVAAKAVFFKETLGEQYRARQFKIVENAKRLARALLDLGHDVLTGGTDNHMALINVGNLREGMSGLVAQRCLEDCGIVVNMNRLPYDIRGAAVTSGVRVGTPIVTRATEWGWNRWNQ
jgi:glycine hydroxymethyltransferase